MDNCHSNPPNSEPVDDTTPMPLPIASEPPPARLSHPQTEFLRSNLLEYVEYTDQTIRKGDSKAWVVRHVWDTFKEKFPRNNTDPTWPSYQRAIVKWYQNQRREIVKNPAKRNALLNSSTNSSSLPPRPTAPMPKTPGRPRNFLDCFADENPQTVHDRHQALLSKTPNATPQQFMALRNAARVQAFQTCDESEREKYKAQAREEQLAARAKELPPKRPKPSEDELIQTREGLRKDIRSYITSFLGDGPGQAGEFIFCGLLAYRNAKDQLRCQSLHVNPLGYDFEGSVDFKKVYKEPFANYAATTLPIRSQHNYVFVRLGDDQYPIFLQNQALDDMTNKQFKAALKEYIQAAWCHSGRSELVPWTALATSERETLLQQDPKIAAFPCLDPEAMSVDKTVALYECILDLEAGNTRPFVFSAPTSNKPTNSPTNSLEDDNDNPFLSPPTQPERVGRSSTSSSNEADWLRRGNTSFQDGGSPEPDPQDTREVNPVQPHMATLDNASNPSPLPPPKAVTFTLSPTQFTAQLMSPPQGEKNVHDPDSSNHPANAKSPPQPPKTRQQRGARSNVTQTAPGRKKRIADEPVDDPRATKKQSKSKVSDAPLPRPDTPPRLPGGWYYTDESTGTTFRPLTKKKSETDMYVCDANGKVLRDADGQFIPFYPCDDDESDGV